jgi:hypothetical protein
MRRSTAPGASLAGLVALILACASQPPPTVPSDPLAGAFSGAQSFEHLEALVALGPRITGSPQLVAARDYVRSQLEALGIEVEEVGAEVVPDEGEDFEAFPFVNLIGVLPGESEDLTVLAAPIDTAPTDSFTLLGANEGASGPALLLELARVLREHPLPYTVWFVFLDAERLPLVDHLGASLFVSTLSESGQLSRLRLFVSFDQVADADLMISRDSNSYETARRIFFRTAGKIGRSGAFPRDRSFEEVDGPHVVFPRHGFQRALTIQDVHYGGNERPGIYWRTEEDTPERCAPESLEAVGDVSVRALHRIGELLALVDHHASPREPEPLPEDEALPAETLEADGEAGAVESLETPGRPAWELEEPAGQPERLAPDAEPPAGPPEASPEQADPGVREPHTVQAADGQPEAPKPEDVSPPAPAPADPADDEADPAAGPGS